MVSAVIGLPERSLLDAGQLPVEELAGFAERECSRPRPIYIAHRWFARRFGTAFRALLVAAVTPAAGDFWRGFYGEADLSRLTVLDPFVGGGTSVVEAQRLGATVTGVDVDPVACAVTRFEVAAANMPALDRVAHELAQQVGKQLAAHYRTVSQTGEELVALHYFWVQVIDCVGCGTPVEAHPHYQLAREVSGGSQWAVCRGCGQVQCLPKSAGDFVCDQCQLRTVIANGPLRYGTLTCPRCGTAQRLIEMGRATGRPPTWRLFAVEAIPSPIGSRPTPLRERSFHAATQVDTAAFEAARAALAARRNADGTTLWLPIAQIPESGRVDDRLIAYGYRRYTELFNDRQLLHLSLLAEAINQLRGPERELCALAFSNHLTTNCMLTAYAFGWRRLSPLFSVRAFRHVPRPVELNPWLAGTGRGSYPNALRRVTQAVEFARRPREFTADGFRLIRGRPALAPPRVLHADARQLPLAEASVDLVLTDPPYFDNIPYSELSDFFAPWLAMLGVIADTGLNARAHSLSAPNREPHSIDRFAAGLRACFAEVARVLRPSGRLVFTFQHSTPGAWRGLAQALAPVPLEPIQVLPLLGNGKVGLHVHEGASTWDAVFVARRSLDTSSSQCRELPELADAGHLEATVGHAAAWERRIQTHLPGRFGPADRMSFRRACVVAASVGFLRPPTAAGPSIPLEEALTAIVVGMDGHDQTESATRPGPVQARARG